MLIFGALYYYLGPFRVVGLLAYMATVPSILRSKQVGLIEPLVLFFMLASAGIRAVQLADPLAALLYIRLYWGLFLFFFYFQRKPDLQVRRFAVGLALLTFVEFVLIRAIPGLWEVLPNYDSTFNGALTWGILGGVHGFGGNRTVTSVLLVSLFAYLEKTDPDRRFRWLPLFASFLCFSGTGMLIAIAYLFLRFRRWYITAPLVALTIVALLFGDEIFPRLTFTYIELMVNFKWGQIQEAAQILGADWYSVLFGSSAVGTSNEQVESFGLFFGDFLFLDFTTRFGLVGLGAMLTFIVSRTHAGNRAAVAMIVIGSLHYHVMFSLPGQMLAGYYLSRAPEPSPEDASGEDPGGTND